MKKIKKSVIITGYKCNNRCRFCCNLHKRGVPESSSEKIAGEVLEAKNRGATYLEIIGGEQTIRADIVELVRFAKKLGFEVISMATNGRMFSYGEFAKDIIGAGLNHIIFSVHGHNAKLHDSLTQVEGSFDQLLEGIKNVRSLGIKDIGSNTTIVKQNYKFLYNIGYFLYKLGIRNAEFIFVDPTRGGALDDFESIVPRLSEAAPFIRSCLDIGKSNGVAHWHIRYVPLCYFEGYEDQISEIQERKIFQTEHLAPDFKNLDVENSRKEIGRVRPEKCKKCVKYDICEGIWVEYYKRYGDKELKPIR
ncbi:MAG: radical SAM protein [Deltaproteobacteria bacterium]|nr:radical SAM protein [Deltaproteobacteria bacterium]